MFRAHVLVIVLVSLCLWGCGEIEPECTDPLLTFAPMGVEVGRVDGHEGIAAAELPMLPALSCNVALVGLSNGPGCVVPGLLDLLLLETQPGSDGTPLVWSTAAGKTSCEPLDGTAAGVLVRVALDAALVIPMGKHALGVRLTDGACPPEWSPPCPGRTAYTYSGADGMTAIGGLVLGLADCKGGA